MPVRPTWTSNGEVMKRVRPFPTRKLLIQLALLAFGIIFLLIAENDGRWRYVVLAGTILIPIEIAISLVRVITKEDTDEL